MVSGPASYPAVASSQRSFTISSWTLASTWCEQDRGLRERGSKAACPPSLNHLRSSKTQRSEIPWSRASRVGLRCSNTTASTM